MDDLITVVVPVYNVEKYLERCISSVLAQSYTNLQIILVDDGSTDESSDICKRLLDSDDRLVYVRQENKGLAGARNTGIDNAKGDYIVFVDSDDFVSNKYVEIMYRALIQNDADMAMCSYIKSNGEMLEQPIKGKYVVYSGKEIIRKMYDFDVLEINVAWNKLYNIEMFREERFPEGKIHEDFVLNTKVMYRAKRIVYCEDKLYYYFTNPDSITRKEFSLKNLDCLEQLDFRMDFYKEVEENGLFARTMLDYELLCLKYYFLIKKYEKADDALRRSLYDEYKRRFRVVMGADTVSLFKKMYVCLGYVLPHFMGWVTNDIFHIS